MNSRPWTEQYRAVIADAIARLGGRREFTNLYLDGTVYKQDDFIGPRFQQIRAKESCVVVFADDHPLSNFAHDCRYLLYDEESHRFLREIAARFPPYVDGPPTKYEVIHTGVLIRIGREIVPPPEVPLQPPGIPVPPPMPRERHAILFAGTGDPWTLNDLEYCYKLLIHFGFKTTNIHVLYHDGNPQSNNPSLEVWSPHTIPINGAGTRQNFQAACTHIQQSTPPADLVFIHTNGHGETGTSPKESFLYQHSGGAFHSSEFCQDLATLGPHKSLLIMMEQCSSAGFINPVIAAKGLGTINAARISIACASAGVSAQTQDGRFNQFAKAWIEAQFQQDLDGKFVASNTSGNAFVEADEAFVHGSGIAVADHPVMGNDPPTAATNIHLA